MIWRSSDKKSSKTVGFAFDWKDTDDEKFKSALKEHGPCEIEFNVTGSFSLQPTLHIALHGVITHAPCYQDGVSNVT